MIVNALVDKPLSVYGDGLNIRDWLYVEDTRQAENRACSWHAQAVLLYNKGWNLRNELLTPIIIIEDLNYRLFFTHSL